MAGLKDMFPNTFVESNLTRATKNNITVSRPDWLLYIIPSIAFVLGLFLFLLVYRTQRRKEEVFRRVAALKNVMNNTAGHTYTSRQGPTGTEIKDSSKPQNSDKTYVNLMKEKAQSYENVTALIYNHISPDADAGDVTETDKTIYLQPLQNVGDTDGESYENMEGSVYAHPRQHTLKSVLSCEDDDYINPDGENKHNLEQTDAESYENMDSLAHHNTDNTHTGDEGWYECMDKKQI